MTLSGVSQAAATSARLAVAMVQLCGVVGCVSREPSPSKEDSIRTAALPAAAKMVEPDSTPTRTCFHVQQSVFARTPTGPSVGPKDLTGWVVLDGREGASQRGAGRLVDSDGQTMQARWERADTLVTVVAADDFLRVELRFSESGNNIRGHADAASDATSERDSAGVMREFRRSWELSGRREGCAKLPSPQR